MKNYYQTLGLSPSATSEEISVAFKRMSKRVHPDMNWGDKVFEEIFKSVNEAYQVLSNEELRREYNQRYNHFFFNNSKNGERENFSDTPTQQVYVPVNKLKQKIFVNSVVSLFVVFAFIVINGFIFKNEEPFIEDTTTQAQAVALNSNKNHEQSMPIIASVNSEEDKLSAKVEENVPAKKETILREKQHSNFSIKPVEEISKPGVVNEMIYSKASAKKKVSTKQSWSESEMMTIVEKIKDVKAKSGSKATCVRLLQSANSNIKNAYSIANYLQLQNFSIAGRLTTAKSTSGLQIDCESDCIVVTIGFVK